jgi:5,10-methenyltetrahydrofolate synthetase
MRMQRGLWNIPIPRDREVLIPEALLVPMVGFDRAHYRLGYGGGYYDRTLVRGRVPPAYHRRRLCRFGASDDPSTIPRHPHESQCNGSHSPTCCTATRNAP